MGRRQLHRRRLGWRRWGRRGEKRPPGRLGAGLLRQGQRRRRGRPQTGRKKQRRRRGIWLRRRMGERTRPHPGLVPPTPQREEATQVRPCWVCAVGGRGLAHSTRSNPDETKEREVLVVYSRTMHLHLRGMLCRWNGTLMWGLESAPCWLQAELRLQLQLGSKFRSHNLMPFKAWPNRLPTVLPPYPWPFTLSKHVHGVTPWPWCWGNTRALLDD